MPIMEPSDLIWKIDYICNGERDYKYDSRVDEAIALIAERDAALLAAKDAEIALLKRHNKQLAEYQYRTVADLQQETWDDMIARHACERKEAGIG